MSIPCIFTSKDLASDPMLEIFKGRCDHNEKLTHSRSLLSYSLYARSSIGNSNCNCDIISIN